VLAAPEGVERLAGSDLPLCLITASIDEGLNEKAYIVPVSAMPVTVSSAECAGSDRQQVYTWRITTNGPGRLSGLLSRPGPHRPQVLRRSRGVRVRW
jgi:hypothetical protein